MQEQVQVLTQVLIPYVPLSSLHFQIGIWSPKQHLFIWEFCMGLPHTLCKQWARGFCKISNFWLLHSVRQNVAGFWRGIFTCFLGHTPLLPAFWATPIINKENLAACKKLLRTFFYSAWRRLGLSKNVTVVPNLVPFEPPAILAPTVVEHHCWQSNSSQQCKH